MRFVIFFVCILVIIGGCAPAARKVEMPAYETSTNIVNLTQITFDNSDERHPACSNDGIYLAFDSNRDGKRHVWLKELRGGSALIQKTFGGQIDSDPEFSPDGSRLVFSSGDSATGTQNIFYVNVGKGMTKTMVTNDQKANGEPSWSPDGGRIAYSANGEIWAFQLMKNQYFQFLPGLAPSWSQDGKHIVFSRAKASGTYKEVLKKKVTQTETFLLLFTYPVEKEIKVEQERPLMISSIWMMEEDGSNITEITSKEYTQEEKDNLLKIVSAEGIGDHRPVFSPDGRWIAFSSSRSGNLDIWIVRPDGTDLTQLTTHPASDGSPCWSPDGTIIFFHSNRTGNYDIWSAEPIIVKSKLPSK